MSSILKVNTLQDAGGNTILSSDGSGTFTTNFTTGKVLQVVTAVDTTKRTTTSTSFVTGSNTATVNITPSSTSNKIFVICSGVCRALDGDDHIAVTLFRGTTNLGNSTSGLVQANSVPNVSATFHPFCMTILDSPSSTSQQTYQLYFRNINSDSDGSSTSEIGGEATGSSNCPTHITAMEIEG